jgi:hypothetical protein
MPLTKEEIIKKIVRPDCIAIYDPILVNVPFSEVFKAMDEYAKQQAIVFGNWMHKCNYAPATEDGKWQNQVAGENDIITTEELHNKFIEQQNKQ